MATAKLFVKIDISESSGYIWVDRMIHESDIESEYEEMIEVAKKFGQTEWDTLECFKSNFLYANVKFDGRKKRIEKDDVLKSIEKEGLTEKVGSGITGCYYRPNEKLNCILANRINKQRELTGLVS